MNPRIGLTSVGFKNYGERRGGSPSLLVNDWTLGSVLGKHRGDIQQKACSERTASWDAPHNKLLVKPKSPGWTRERLRIIHPFAPFRLNSGAASLGAVPCGLSKGELLPEVGRGGRRLPAIVGE